MLNSIKAKLSVWFILVFSVFSIGLSFYLYESQKNASLAAVDAVLQSKSLFLAGLIDIYKDGKVEFELQEKKKSFQRQTTLYDIPDSGHYYQVLYEDRNPLAISPSLGSFRLPLSTVEALKDRGYFEDTAGPKGKPLRIYTRKVTVTTYLSKKGYRNFIIQTAESLEDVYSHLDSLKEIIFYGIPVTFLIAGFGGLFISWISLRPLKRFSHEVTEVSEKCLDKRVNKEGASKELKELAEAFNNTLERIENAFGRQKRFISDASHELRTPVSVIRSYCEIPLRKTRGVEEYKQALETILKHIDMMEVMIERLLTLSRLEQKEFPMRMERLALSGLINDTLSLLPPIAEKTGIQVNFVPPSAEIYIMGDRPYLIEAFINITDNALKYNRAGGSVTITLHENADEAIVEIADTGIGIPDGEIPHIFQRFYRVDASRSKGQNMITGAGLGLSIANEIVERHGGRIDVRSKTGEGSVFSMHLKKD